MKQDEALSPAIDLDAVQAEARARADDATNDALYRLAEGAQADKFLMPGELGFISKGDAARDARALSLMVRTIGMTAAHVRANFGPIRWVQEPTFAANPVGYEVRWHFALAA